MKGMMVLIPQGCGCIIGCTLVRPLQEAWEITLLRRCDMWADIIKLRQFLQLPWILLGDFNVPFSNTDKIGERPVTSKNTNLYYDRVHEIEVHDLKKKGLWYTWTNRVVGQRGIMVKLDRVLVSGDWTKLFPDAEAACLPTASSDHGPCVITLYYGNPMYTICRKLKGLKKLLRQWAKSRVGNTHHKVLQARDHLEQVQFEFSVLDWFTRLWELEKNEYWGYIRNCGTEGNLHGILVGREVLPDGILYASRESHYSVFKAARMYRMECVKVDTLVSRKIDCKDFRTKLVLNKDKPAILNVNIGATVKGAVDALDLLAFWFCANVVFVVYYINVVIVIIVSYKSDFFFHFRMLPPSRSMSSSSNPMEQSPIPSPIHAGGSHEHFDTSGGGSSKTKIQLRFSLLGHVVGKNSTKFMSHFGSLVREHIPPYYPNWPIIPLKSKDTVWDMICKEYVLPQASKRKLIRLANTIWKNEKNETYDECDTDDERKKNRPKKTKPEDWVRFVNLTSTEEVKASRERNKINRSKMVTQHDRDESGIKFQMVQAEEVGQMLRPCRSRQGSQTPPRVKQSSTGNLLRRLRYKVREISSSLCSCDHAQIKKLCDAHHDGGYRKWDQDPILEYDRENGTIRLGRAKRHQRQRLQ
ncbi:hypothetical protein GIB67_038903 [Kingdonia uniflora]|uniref:Endonuclease/exonuclease/phosphatase domain-containing protein n=1 Tax=Kingdonia uniflora TaxID=39325 RepID=A0A7J7LQL8_9MAGN|nr:hypothetical protein GIB67_038903 [Kingdonia uniflora]